MSLLEVTRTSPHGYRSLSTCICQGRTYSVYDIYHEVKDSGQIFVRSLITYRISRTYTSPTSKRTQSLYRPSQLEDCFRCKDRRGTITASIELNRETYWTAKKRLTHDSREPVFRFFIPSEFTDSLSYSPIQVHPSRRHWKLHMAVLILYVSCLSRFTYD